MTAPATEFKCQVQCHPLTNASGGPWNSVVLCRYDSSPPAIPKSRPVLLSSLPPFEPEGKECTKLVHAGALLPVCITSGVTGQLEARAATLLGRNKLYAFEDVAPRSDGGQYGEGTFEGSHRQGHTPST
ncbi:hypothetical protein FB45DRAFT_1021539 [Roridomyces roridus]|uniref:Uncharacterized protein n=1 Tax=Roridomyces roridus TaxID=1738132 RepID=A0AAD7CCT1_9AGAR|nr:hypothetical protein FB45DRAFT_1031903 [Roridomyces roridus]KAJ7644796.1 hypothetical protein FB45DRAFT_1021539 [Roridomyces roridus]